MTKSYEEILAENEELRRSLGESQELLRAISSGEVDALVVSRPEGEQVFTLEGADRAYRVLIEAMNDGALTIDLRRDHSLLQQPLRRDGEIFSRKSDRIIHLPFHPAS